jgi:hypothetical protein
MSSIASRPFAEKGQRTLPPAPSAEMYGLLAILKRPMPLRALRPAALASGLTMAQVESAISVATRRGELRIVADRDGLPIAIGGGRG